jgi:hypothetical protein
MAKWTGKVSHRSPSVNFKPTARRRVLLSTRLAWSHSAALRYALIVALNLQCSGAEMLSSKTLTLKW